MAVKKRFPAKTATVYCNGGCHAKREDGHLLCKEGCIGCGQCEEACRFDAIHVTEQGVAVVQEDKCIACGACVRKCPQKIIGIRLQDNRIAVLCSNKDKGFDPVTKTGASKICTASCIACGLCVKVCPANAIHIVDNHAVIDEKTCLSCGMCATVCPRGVIHDTFGILTENGR